MVNFSKFVFLFLFSIVSVYGSAQADIPLNEKFRKYEIIKLDSRKIYQEMNSKRYGGQMTLMLNDELKWDLNLTSSNLVDENYVLNVGTESGIKTFRGTTALPMNGYIANHTNSRVSLTFNNDFIFGFIQDGDDRYFIEPLSHFKSNTNANEFIFYNTNDIIVNRELKCGYDEYKDEMDSHRHETHHGHNNNVNRAGLCLELEVNLAADYSMVQKYGSVSGAENHNLGVLNNVKTNYDDEFADELKMILREQWISSCSSCDPWTSSTDSGALLNSFTSWAAGGFSTSHDVASLWSNRNFNGSTIGLAWVGTACTSYKYNVLQDFSSDGELKRCLQAHEIGHNFNADHTSTGIMMSSVSYANFWNSISINEIQDFYDGKSCFSMCVPSNPPVADFSFQIIDNCIPVYVQFNNESTFATSYQWTFEGGTPSTSTLQNPLITYLHSGTYSVTLTAFNGSQQNTKVKTITISGIDPPTADFNYNIYDYQVDFNYIGAGATYFEWNFGDNSPYSYLQNPSHTYANNGTYLVTLTVSNDCGVSSISYNVDIFVAPQANFTSNVTSGCNPLTVNFINQSKDGDTFLWSFPGGTPSTSSDQNPTVVYNIPGVFDVTLEVSNYAGTDIKTELDYINVSASPIAGFTHVLNGSQVTLTDTSHFGTSYLWDFGDGTTSTLQNPVHNYLDNGIYTITQLVSNSCNENTSTTTITIAVPPIPSFTSDYTTAICVGESVQFTSTTSYSPTTYLWEFEGGTPATSTDENPLVQYNTGGTFNVTLTVTNAYGSNQVVLGDYIVVEAKPGVSFTYRADGLKLDFTQNITNGTNPIWDFGDGNTSSETDPTHIFASEGNYTVTLSADNRCGTSEYSLLINVLLLPTADFDAVETVICPGGSVQFENLSSPSATSWDWTFEGGIPATSTDENPVVVYSNPGKYFVTLTVVNQSGQGTITKNEFITVLAPVTASFTGQVNSNQIALTNTGSGSISSLWDVFNDGFSESLTGNNPIFTAPKNGTYNVVLTNSNQCGQAVSDTLSFTISAYPNASYTANGGGILCVDATIQFEGEGGLTYQWEFEGGSPATSTETNPEVRYNASGTYNVTLIATNDLGSDTIHSTVHVTTGPKADFDFVANDGTVQFLLTGSGQSTQFWDFGDGSVSFDINPEHTYTNSGEYRVELITSNGCGSDTITKVVGITVGVADLLAEYGIKVFPNPANDIVQIEMTKNIADDFVIQLLNTTGQLIKEQQFIHSESKIVSFNVQDVQSGLYLLNIKTNKIVVPYKIFILR